MKKTAVIVMGLLIVCNGIQAQDSEMWYKLSPEIRLNIENTPWEFRWRPDDHIILPDKYSQYIGKNNIARTDIMIGANISSFKVFNYSKFDELGNMWTGLRLDFNTAILSQKLLINIQERVFFGLNKQSDNHYYLVQFIRYILNKNIQAGYLGYGKWEFARPLKNNETAIAFSDGNWFMGPTVNIGLPYNFNLHLALTKDIFHPEINMLFVRAGYRIKIKNKKNEPNAE
jgi:hypothetical protein